MADAPPIPDGEYGVIYADPPWQYDDGGVPNGGVDHHYETMDLDAIRALDVPAADDCVLYLWATVTHAQAAFEVLEAWGFEYKTQAVWDKQQLGVGYWFRGEHELLYVGVRGDVSPPDESARRSSIFREQRTEHSAKPKCVRRHIEQAHPDAEKIELFSREGWTGWDVWGDEAPELAQSSVEDF